MLFVPWLRRTATLECYFCFFKAMVGFPGCSALSQQHNKEESMSLHHSAHAAVRSTANGHETPF